MCIAVLIAIPFRPAVAQAQVIGLSTDVGAVGMAGDGTFTASTGAYQIDGAGIGLAGSADAFHFAYYESVCGDGQMVVRLVSADAGAQASLVVRESLDPSAAFAAASVAGGNAQYVRRLATGNNTVAGAPGNASAPCWLKVVRSGTVLSAFVSLDGQNWTSLGTDTVTLASPTIYVGLAVSNGVANATTTARATFDSVQSTFLPNEGLLLWLRADVGVTQDASGSVSTWADQSGNGNDASQPSYTNAPLAVVAAINGQPVIHFDGGGSFLQLPAGFNDFGQGLTALVVARPTGVGSWQRFFDFGNGAGADNVYLARHDTSNDLRYQTLNGGQSTTDVSAGGVLALNACQLLEVVHNPAGNLVTLYKNGTPTAQAGAGSISGVTRTNNFIAKSNWNDALYQGDIAEIVLFKCALSDTQRQAWESYLNAKYQFNPPPTAPAQLVATPLSGTQAALNWIDTFGNISSFLVEQQNADGTWSVIATLPAGTTRYTVTGLNPGTAHQFQVIAVNQTGNSPPAAVSLIIPASVGALPAGDIRLWLRADSGTVTDSSGLLSQWTDASGNGLSASQGGGSQPTVVASVLNGQPVVHFDGGSSFLNLPGNLTNNLSGAEVYVVLRAADPLSNVQRGLWRFDDNNLAEYPWSDGNLYDTFGSSGQYGYSPGGAALDQFNLYNVSAAATGEWTARLNGEVLRHSTNNAVRFSAGAYTLGRDRDGRLFAGDIAEVILFDRALTDSERQSVEQYLSAKYALAALPVAPTSLAARALSPTQVSLTWQYPAESSAMRFSVQRQGPGDNGFQTVASVENATSLIDNTAVAGTAYTYQVVAANPAGSLSPVSNQVQISTPAAGQTMPTNGLRLWLKADAGTTASLDDWEDQSGHGNDAQQGNPGSQPTVVTNVLNGRPVVRFDGSRSVLQMPNSLFTNVSSAEVYIVLRAADPVGGQQGLWRFTDRENDFYPENDHLCATFGTQNRYAPIGVATPLDQFNLYNVSAAPNAWTARMNGQTIYTSASNTVDFNAGAYLLGQTRDGQHFAGDIAEVLIFDHALSTDDRLAVEQYLAGKYSLASAPAVPNAVSAHALSPTQINVTWQYPAGSSATQFAVERALAGTNNYQVVAVVDNGTSYLDNTAAPGTAYSYQVVATDLAGNASAASSAAQAATVTGGANFPGGLRVWLEADADTTAGSLSSWIDQSGNGNDAQQGNLGNQPAVVADVLNGQPVVRFNGNSVLQFPGNPLSGVTASEVFVVLKTANPSGGEQGLWRFTDRENDFYPENNYLCATFGTQNRYAPIGATAPLDQFNLYDVSAAPNAWAARLNGQLLHSSTSNTVDFNAGAYLLGQTRDGYRWNGDMAEILIFDHALSVDERHAVEQYVSGKYALVSSPAIPSNLGARALSPTQVSLTWQYPQASSAVRFNVERQIGTAGGYQSLGVVENAASFIDSSASAGTAYTYRVEAINLSGSVSTASNETQVTTPATGTALPVGDLCLWLKADANATATLGDWVDQSGSSNDAQQGSPGNQPTVVTNIVNGQPVVHFDGCNTVLQMPGGLFQGVNSSDVFVVLRAGDPVGGEQGLWRFTDRDNDFYPENNYLCATFGTQNRHAPIGVPVPLDQFNLYNVSAAPNAWTARLNGEVLYTTANNTVDFGAGAYLLGQTRDGYRWNGDIAEVMIFNHALSAQDRLAVEQYLAGKYALASTPAVPTGVSVQALSPTQTSITWQYPPTDSGTQFTIERAVAGTGTYQVIAVVANATSFIDNTAVAGTAYLYRVTATDLAGNVSAASGAGQISTPASGTNLPTTGLQMWLRADAGAPAGILGAWLDQSGNGNHAQQGGPGQQPTVVTSVLNGRPVVRFDGRQGQYLNLPDIFGASAGGTAGELVVVLRSTAAPGTNNGLGQFGTYGGSLYPNGDGSLYSDFGTNNQYGEGVPAPDLGQFNIYDLSSQANLWQSWMDGVPLYQNTGSAVNFQSSPALGYYNWYGGYYFTGDIAEVLAYDRVLTPDERQSLNAYLTQKYQLLPAPATPTSLSATQLSPTENLIAWSGTLINAPVEYVILRANSPDGPYADIGTTYGGTYLDNTAVAGQTYYYQVYAQDAGGSSGTTAAVAVTTPQTNGQGVPTTGLQTWLMGDGAWENPVSNWHDYSGQGHDATQNASSAAQQPTVVPNVLNGRPAVHFDATRGQYLNLPNAFGDTPVTAGELVIVLRSATAGGTNNGLGQFGTVGGTLYPNGDGRLYSDFGTNTQYGEGVPATDLTRFNIYDVSSQANLWQSWMDGVPFFQSLNNATSFVTNPTLGYYNWYGGYYFTGDVAEVLVYNRALTPDERQSLNAYLTQKYQLLPAPATPTNLSATQLSATENLVSWDGTISNVPTSYVILRANSPAGPFTTIATVVGSGTYLDTTAVAGQTYYYQVYAQDAGGQSTTTAAVATTNPQTNGQGVPTAGLQTWLMGDGAWESPVSNWHDYSGLGNDAVQNGSSTQQPTVVPSVLNGKAVVHFDGSQGQYLNLPDVFGAATATAGEMVIVLRNSSAPGTNNGLGQFGTVGGTLYPNGDGSLYSDFGTNNQYGEGVPAGSLGQFNIYDVNSQANLWQSWVDGVPLYQRQSNTVNFTSAPTLGYYNWYGGYYFTGDMAEVLIYNRTLTPTERQSVNAYLTQKYQLLSAPATPTSLSATQLSDTENLVSWTSAVGDVPTSYVVLRASSPDGPYTVIATVVGSGTYLDTTAVAGQTYYYQVYAQNAGGQSSATTAVAAVNPQSDGTGMPTAGLRLWLMGDGAWESPVSNWHDYSGYGNDAVQNTSNAPQRPTVVPGVVNGRPVVRFDGSQGQYLNLPDIFGANTGGTAGELVVVLRNSSAPGTNNGLGQFGTVGGTLYPNGDGSLYSDFGANNQYGEGVPAPDLTQFNVYDVSSQANLWQSWVDGVLLYQRQSNTVSFSGSPTLGYYNWYGGYYFTGDVAEVLAYDRVLTAAERQSLNAYLTQKYQIVPVPATPTGLQVIALSQTQNLVSWNEPVGDDPLVYTILRADSPNGPYSVISTVVGGSGTYLDTTAVLGQTYYYEVYVQNSAGSSGTTAAATALNAQPVVQSLPTAGLQLWLMGDGAWESPVSNWHDYSGNGNDATQNASNAALRPTVVPGVLNGKTVLHFDATQGQYLNLPDVFNAATATAGEMIVVLRNSATAGTNNGLGQFGTVGGTLYPNGDGNLYSDFGTNTQYGEGVPVANEGLPAADLTQFNVYDLSSQTGQWQSWINEVPFFQSLNNTTSFVSNPTLGYYNWYGGYYFTGDVAEVLVFNRVLTPTERHAITWYLAAKYLLPNYDLDGDGLTTAQKLAQGLNPFNGMDSNGLFDSTNLQLGINPQSPGFIYTTPPNPNGSGNTPPPANPNDHTPPVITLTAPANAVPLP